MAKYEWVGVDKELEYMATVDWASILDFKDDSMGSWEEEGWDQNLGPIPFDMLIEPTDSKFDLTHTPPTPIGTTPETYPLEDADGSCIHDSDEVPKFQMPSLESELKPLTSKQKRSKRCRPVGISRWSLISPLFKRRRERRNKLPCLSPTSQTSEISVCSTNVVSSLSHAKKCSHCGIMKTPQWREGPLGPKTLCNACGVRHRSGRLFPEYRPAASPTFVPSLHSNSHKKVIEMRNRGQNKVEKIEQPKMPPKIEFSYR